MTGTKRRKKGNKRPAALFVAATVLAFTFSACAGGSTGGAPESASSAPAAEETSPGVRETDTSEVSGDYYLNLTELGMKLTIYLRLGSDGNFLFSNTTDFEVNKSAGTFQKSEGEYVMVFTSVNGEDKSISDGLTGSFFVTDGGVLDFTSCERIYYGTASATTTSADHPGAKLLGVPIGEDYEAPSDETAFKVGTYTCEEIGEDGTGTYYSVHFFEDETYVLHAATVTGENTEILGEGGRYGVSTTQLAMEPEGDSRVSNEVIDADTLRLAVPTESGGRETKDFSRTEAKEIRWSFTGTGEETGNGKSFQAELTVYNDGTFRTEADGFSEEGVLVLNTADATCKIYPDHPTEGSRGLSYVATVPMGEVAVSPDDTLILSGFRIRRSDGLNRDKCDFTESRE